MAERKRYEKLQKTRELGMKRRRVEKSTYVPKIYDKPGIPYNSPDRKKYWRIKKDLPADVYWKKRYWRRRISGLGDYKMSSSRSTGANYGGWAGSKAGEFLGGMAQTALTSILTGMGDYSVKQNVFLGGNLPQMVNDSEGGGTVIRFQEYLGDVFTGDAGAFSIRSYILNPANKDMFPFLSQIAANYEQYQFEGVVLQFKSTSADALNSTNTALGSVMLATQYDQLDRPFTSKGEMLNHEFSTSCKPSDNVVHMIECAPAVTTLTKLYTLQGNVPVGADPRFYNLGRFSIATTGFQATNVNIGELHVTYQVRLIKPKIFDTIGDGTPYFLRRCSSFSNNEPFGTDIIEQRDDIGGLVATEDTIVFPASAFQRFWLLSIIWTGTTGVTARRPGLGGINLDLGTYSYAPQDDTVNQDQIVISIPFVTNGNNLKSTLLANGLGELPVGTQQVIIQITQTNPLG